VSKKLKHLKVTDVKGLSTIFHTYRLVPYPEIVKVIENDGEAFVERIDRRTAYSAKKILSKKLGYNVKAEKRILVTSDKGDHLEGIEGYVFFKQ